MPEIGEIKYSVELGHNPLCGRPKGRPYIWHACINCGKERWVGFAKKQPKTVLCRSCAMKEWHQKNPFMFIGEKSIHWKGHHSRANLAGYIRIRVYPEDFFYSMATCHGFILEHRLIMAKHLKRCLLPWEVVHHKNGIKSDNRLENLELLGGRGKHNTLLNILISKQQKDIEALKKRVTLLEAENIFLVAEIEKRLEMR